MKIMFIEMPDWVEVVSVTAIGSAFTRDYVAPRELAVKDGDTVKMNVEEDKE